MPVKPNDGAHKQKHDRRDLFLSVKPENLLSQSAFANLWAVSVILFPTALWSYCEALIAFEF